MNTISDLHSLYCRLTGMHISLAFDREHFWFLWLKQGFTGADLELVVKMIWRKIPKGERRIESLKFRNLIEQLDRFEEDLAVARAEHRNSKPPPSARERAVSQLRPNVTETVSSAQTARPVGELIEQLKQAAGMKP